MNDEQKENAKGFVIHFWYIFVILGLVVFGIFMYNSNQNTKTELNKLRTQINLEQDISEIQARLDAMKKRVPRLRNTQPVAPREPKISYQVYMEAPDYLELLFKQMDDSYATIMRQSYFAIFEQQAHEMVQKHASVDEISDVYFETLKQQFGDALDISDEFRWEWVSIPHIYHTPFYVYAYSFGQLLVFSLYQQFKVEGQAFKPRYIKLLSSGGSKSPAKILSEAGIDMHSASFWQGGFDVIRRLVEQLEAIPVVK